MSSATLSLNGFRVSYSSSGEVFACGSDSPTSHGAASTAVRQAFGATALFVAALGTGGYAVRRDLTFLYRIAFWLLLALILAGIVLIFTRMQAAYTAYAIAGLAIFGLYTVIDFNRLRRAGNDEAIPLAAAIFLDVFNIFLFFLQLFGRNS